MFSYTWGHLKRISTTTIQSGFNWADTTNLFERLISLPPRYEFRYKQVETLNLPFAKTICLPEMRLLLLFVLFVVSVNGDDRSDLINKFRTYISSFLSTEQLNYVVILNKTDQTRNFLDDRPRFWCWVWQYLGVVYDASRWASFVSRPDTGFYLDMSSMIMEKLTTEQYLTGMMLFSDAMREFGTIDAMKTMAMQCASRPMEILLPLGLKARNI